MKEDNISIVEKPEWLSWDDIRNHLIEAHAGNRERGINNSRYGLPADEIRDFIGENGRMLVALDGEKLVGTLGLADKKTGAWFTRGRYAYFCFGATNAEYAGHGIYSRLSQQLEQTAIALNYKTLLLDTHYKNMRLQAIAKRNGFRLVSFAATPDRDHYYVVMVKWVGKEPHSPLYCHIRYLLSKLRTYIKPR